MPGSLRLLRRVRALARADPAGVRAGFVAHLLATTTGLVAGLILGSITGTLEELPGLLVLVPAAVGLRGNVFGALGSRLGTLVATGSFRLSRRTDTEVGQNLVASIALSFGLSLVLALIAKGIAEAFGVRNAIGIGDFIVISVVGAIIPTAVVMAITVGIAAIGVRREWDVDNVSVPVVTAAGDMVTLPSLFLATYLVLDLPDEAIGVLTIICTVIGVGCILASLRSRLPSLRRIVAESLPFLVDRRRGEHARRDHDPVAPRDARRRARAPHRRAAAAVALGIARRDPLGPRVDEAPPRPRRPVADLVATGRRGRHRRLPDRDPDVPRARARRRRARGDLRPGDARGRGDGRARPARRDPRDDAHRGRRVRRRARRPTGSGGTPTTTACRWCRRRPTSSGQPRSWCPWLSWDSRSHGRTRRRPPRNLKAMLSESKDTSELMVDLGVRRALLLRRAHGRRGRRARGAPERPRARDVRDLRARRALAARSRRDVERAARHRVDRADGERGRRRVPRRVAPARHPRRARRRPRGRPRRSRTGCACARTRRSRTGRSPTSSCRWRSACASSPSAGARSGSSTPTATRRSCPTTS